ncbi:FadR/GntR family transcriptional regulator [Priestia abyssalis]|uniref:FadR/GntR family transcriptional regulator n=1 Tax=Priestia abyssalis TaxID=1221450 RepID=UPI000995504A|nr:FadR/GntR family transcriptional regulator [Priestia abyssalis]
MIEPVKRSNVGDLIVNQIKRLILEGKLKPGDRLLPERELMDMFQVGRTSLREGLKVLESQGLLERSQKGTFISKNYHQFLSDSLMYQIVFADTELEDLFEARRIIEKELVYLAALRASNEDLVTIAKTIEGMEKAIEAHDQKEYVMMDMLFHESIAKASKNLVMCDLYNSIKNLVFQAVKKAGIMNESLVFHKKIYEAIKQRQADIASQMMLEHMQSVYTYLKDCE